MITYGSVCSGIEAATAAWHTLGFVPAWFSEIEPFPRALLKYRYPQVPNLGDMTRIAAWVRAGIVSAPDVLVGGTPCQAFSIAGVRAGLLDPRGQLTLAYADLLNAIDEKRPGNECVAVWENVPGVLSDKTNAFGCFLAILAGEDVELVAPGGKWPNAGCVVGSQRTIAWRVLDAQYFGVAQRRRRVFVVASARDGFDPAAVLFELDGVRRDSPPSRETGQSVAGRIASRTTGGGFPGTDEACSGYLQPVTCVAHDDAPVAYPIQDVCGTLQANGKAAGSATQQDAEAGTLVSILAFNSNAQPDQMRFDPELSAALTCSQYSAVAFAENSRGELRLEGGDGQRTGALSTGGGKPGQGQPVVCVTGSVTHCLKAEGFDASEDGTGRGQPIVAASREVAQCLTSNYGKQLDNSDTNLGPNVAIYDHAVRRLTPRECERLQGFPDDHTAIPFGRYIRPEKLEKDWAKYIMRGGNLTLDQVCTLAADGPRYKALGNSMAVPCMRWIGFRLMLNLLLTRPSLLAHTVQNQGN